MLLNQLGIFASQKKKKYDYIPLTFSLYEPPLASNEWVTDASGKVLNITDAQFLALFYDDLVGTHDDGMVVTKTSLGLDESGTYHIYEYDFCPLNYTKTILLSSGMHTYELSASFGLAHFINDMMAAPYKHVGFGYLRQNVRIKVIPIINPWGWNQNPKAYGNVNGVNINRNFDIDGRWAAFEGNTNEWDQKGTEPFSEAETQILRDWGIANNTAEFWIDCHTGLSLGPWDNFIYYLSADPLVSKITSALSRLEDRIKIVYGKATPTKEVRIDSEGSIRSFWVLGQGISTFTLEQTPNNLLWGTSLNNEAGDITEFEVALCAYLFTFLASVPPVPPGTVVASDTFNRPDGALGQTEVGNKTWENALGTFVIASNKAKVSTLTGNNARTAIDLGVSDFDISVDIDWRYYTSVYFRAKTNSDNYHARISSAGLGLFVWVNDVGSALGDSYAFTPIYGTTYNLRIVANGTSIKVYLNGVERISATDATYLNYTKVGLRTYNDYEATFDNFIVKTV